MPTATLRQAKSMGKLELLELWIADYPDVENYLSLFYSATFPMAQIIRILKMKILMMYENALKIVSDSLRFRKYREMDSLVLSDFPIVPLYYDEVVRFVQKNIIGMEINPINLLVLKNVKKKE